MAVPGPQPLRGDSHLPLASIAYYSAAVAFSRTRDPATGHMTMLKCSRVKVTCTGARSKTLGSIEFDLFLGMCPRCPSRSCIALTTAPLGQSIRISTLVRMPPATMSNSATLAPTSRLCCASFAPKSCAYPALSRERNWYALQGRRLVGSIARRQWPPSRKSFFNSLSYYVPYNRTR
jgi:hypothetical protein